MKFKKILLILLLVSISLFAHKMPDIILEATKVQNNKVHIKSFFKRSKKPLVGNELQFISMFDTRVLDSGYLNDNGLILDIPSESYWIYLIIRDDDIVIDGIAPQNGFIKVIEQKKVAFIYSSGIVTFLIVLASFIGYRKTRKFKLITLFVENI